MRWIKNLLLVVFIGTFGGGDADNSSAPDDAHSGTPEPGTNGGGSGGLDSLKEQLDALKRDAEFLAQTEAESAGIDDDPFADDAQAVGEANHDNECYTWQAGMPLKAGDFGANGFGGAVAWSKGGTVYTFGGCPKNGLPSMCSSGVHEYNAAVVVCFYQTFDTHLTNMVSTLTDPSIICNQVVLVC